MFKLNRKAMSQRVKIKCNNCENDIYISGGESLAEIIETVGVSGEYPYLAAMVNNTFKELDYKVYDPATIEFIDITHFEGIRIYMRTLFFILSKAVHDLFPEEKLQVKHAVAKGFYFEIDGMERLSDEQIDQIKERMEMIISLNIPIVRQRVTTQEAEVIYRQMGYDDKIELLHSQPRLYSTIYRLADIAGYFYGVLGASTGIIHLFDICKYYHGIYLALPKQNEPSMLEHMINQDKMFGLFEEYKDWCEVVGIPNMGALNSQINCGNSSDIIKITEALQEKKLSTLADHIAEKRSNCGLRVVLISGPSSSGKTTFAKRLGIQLRVVGLNPVLVSLDDYFVDRTKTPLDDNGEYDYESLYALDLPLLNEQIQQLINGEAVRIPKYNFITGTSSLQEMPLQLQDNSVLVIEGIHALNPELLSEIDSNLTFKIYVSALTSLSMDDLSYISTTDNRLLRRMVRDYATRGSDAVATLHRWASVRRGEDKHIFPYQENADEMFNSSLIYEISALKKYAMPILREVPNTMPEHATAKKLMKFLDNFVEIDSTEIPLNSIIREFIGGGNFKY